MGFDPEKVKGTIGLIKLYPAVALIVICMMVMASVSFLYLQGLAAEKAEKSDVDSLRADFKNMSSRVEAMKDDVSEIKAAVKYLAKKSGYEPENIMTIPPSKYWIDAPDSLRARAPWDSCFIGRVENPETGRPPCVCYKGDTVDATFK